MRLVPEAERILRRIVLGLDANKATHFLLPPTDGWALGSRDPRVVWLRRQIYWLDFELQHGHILHSAPPYSRFYVSVPDPPATGESIGNEEEIFREYLRERVGWTPLVIAERVRFFAVPEPIPFPQDMAEAMGYDASGRLALGLGSEGDSHYTGAVEKLAAAYPDQFVIRPLPNINTEGGDLALVRLPESGVGLLVGRHRVLRYVQVKHPDAGKDGPVAEARIEEARHAYQAAFDGVETIVVGAEALRDPRLGNPEIYHLDMLVVIRGSAGVAAFVPTYVGKPIDALTRVKLPEEAVRRFQAEFDRTARQLAARGYRVARVPFADHPARNPVGVGKFVDPETGHPAVLLGRYPDHLEPSADRNAEVGLRRVFASLDDSVLAWREAPTDERWHGVQAAVARAWTQMDRAVQTPNPMFESQRRIYEAHGIRVIPVPIFPMGEGGIHCLVLK